MLTVDSEKAEQACRALCDAMVGSIDLLGRLEEPYLTASEGDCRAAVVLARQAIPGGMDYAERMMLSLVDEIPAGSPDTVHAAARLLITAADARREGRWDASMGGMAWGAAWQALEEMGFEPYRGMGRAVDRLRQWPAPGSPAPRGP